MNRDEPVMRGSYVELEFHWDKYMSYKEFDDFLDAMEVFGHQWLLEHGFIFENKDLSAKDGIPKWKK